MHDVEALQAGLEVGEGAAVVGGRDLAPQVRHEHDLVACIARLLDQVVALAGDEHDLVMLRIEGQRAAQRTPPARP